MATVLQGLVDSMIDRARAEHPGVAYSIIAAPDDALLLVSPTDAGGQVYRDCLVEPVGTDRVVGLVPLDASGPTYYGLLDSAEITTKSPFA